MGLKSQMSRSLELVSFQLFYSFAEFDTETKWAWVWVAPSVLAQILQLMLEEQFN